MPLQRHLVFQDRQPISISVSAMTIGVSIQKMTNPIIFTGHTGIVPLPFSERGRLPPWIIHPSENLKKERETTEIVGLRVEQGKSMKELEKIEGPREHPALAEKRARGEVAKLDLDEHEPKKKLEALKKEEIRKAQGEEEARIQQEMERQRPAKDQLKFWKERKKRKKSGDGAAVGDRQVCSDRNVSDELLYPLKLEEDPAREWQRVGRCQKIFRGRIKRKDRGE